MFKAEVRRFMEEVRRDLAKMTTAQIRILDRAMGNADWMKEYGKEEGIEGGGFEEATSPDQDDNFAGEIFDPAMLEEKEQG